MKWIFDQYLWTTFRFYATYTNVCHILFYRMHFLWKIFVAKNFLWLKFLWRKTFYCWRSFFHYVLQVQKKKQKTHGFVTRMSCEKNRKITNGKLSRLQTHDLNRMTHAVGWFENYTPQEEIVWHEHLFISRITLPRSL